jgi:hypothetical protein
LRRLENKVDAHGNALNTKFDDLRRDLAEEFRAQRAEVLAQTDALAAAITARRARNDRSMAAGGPRGLRRAHTGARVALAVLILVLALAALPARAGQPFDWDRYHARQDACREADRIAQDCTKGVAWCDELALRQAKRACSAFGPLGEGRR